jgi:hypothetical protein
MPLLLTLKRPVLQSGTGQPLRSVLNWYQPPVFFRRASLTLQLCLTLPAARALTHFPARGCRCYNLLVAFRRCVSRTQRSQASSLTNGGMVQGSARQVLNLKTRVRFPVPLPISLA